MHERSVNRSLLQYLQYLLVPLLLAGALAVQPQLMQQRVRPQGQ